ncbi:MAG: aminotransferase class I/II-fold pyridoxal phosphate-dependent enzyme [Pseudomonadota bacterium]
MNLPERFSNLPEYTWPRLRALLDPLSPGGTAINMTIGEPRHAFPDFTGPMLQEHLAGFGKYPANNGTDALLEAISEWLNGRFDVDVSTDRIMALNGTREGLYNAAVALGPAKKNGAQAAVLIPNPFYQVYAVGARASGAEPVFVPATAETAFLPDFGALPGDLLERTTIAYICSPSNPQGAVADEGYWRDLLALAEKHDFRVFSDECYSEVWRHAPPPGALEMVAKVGANPEHVCAFHSLSKRSNLPGLRSGFVAGGAESIAAIRQLRAYAGAPLPGPIMAVSEAVWRDEAHVMASRARYQAKYDIADAVFDGIADWAAPEAGFFCWLPVDDGEKAAKTLWQETGVRVLPGAYLSRDVDGANPGAGYIRVAMVVEEDELRQGLTLIKDCILR